MSTEAIPEDIRETVVRLVNDYGFDSEVLAGAVCAALLAERRRTVEQCAVIALDEDGHFSHWGEDRNSVVAQQTCKDIAAAIRAQLK